MGILRVTASADTFITTYRYNGIAQTGSNFGASEVLQVFNIASVSGSSNTISGSVARTLIKFDLTNVQTLINNGTIFENGLIVTTPRYFLRLADSQHGKTLPSSFDLIVDRVSQSWDEGNGIDVDTYFDLGWANWDKAKSNVFWFTTGSTTVSPTLSVAQHFDTGHEDLFVDVTSQVNSWLTGNIANNGFVVKLPSSQEGSNTNYYLKQFFSRTTQYNDLAPYLEVRWDDSIQDNRSNFALEFFNILFLYNSITGFLSDLNANNVYVKISDISGTILQYSTASIFSTGIYQAIIPPISSGSFSGSVLYDTWFSGSTVFLSSSFIPVTNSVTNKLRPSRYIVDILNLKNEYESDEKVRFEIFTRTVDFNPAIVLTGSNNNTGIAINTAYYKIINEKTKKTVVPFIISTGVNSPDATRLSFDESRNYFDFFMSSLPSNNVYRIIFLYMIDGQNQIIDQGFKFKIKPNLNYF